MIKVTAGIHSTWELFFDDIEDVARNFHPSFNADRPQNFTYIDVENNCYISWREIVNKRNELKKEQE